MKKIKKLLSLTAASLIMGGMIFSLPKNTTTASAGIMRYPKNEKYYNQPQTPLKGRYLQMFSVQTKDLDTRKRTDWVGLFQVNSNGILEMVDLRLPPDKNVLDDDYLFAVLDKDCNLRFKFGTDYNPKMTANEELKDLINEFNKLKVGEGNYLVCIPKYSLDRLRFDMKYISSIVKIGYNNFDAGFSDTPHKYSTVLKVTNQGLVETKYKLDTVFGPIIYIYA